MAYFKKRRAKTVNKNEARQERADRAESEIRRAGVVGSRFPGVKRLTLSVTFLDARKNPLEDKKLSLGPNDPAVFKHSCPGMCGQGTFDFTMKIADIVAAQTPSSEFGVPCPERQGSGTPCGCEARVALQVEYIPQPQQS